MMRDARINQIGEGANEVLTFVYRVGGDARAWHGVQGNLRHDDEPTREQGFAKRGRPASIG
jgi:hypothetical protein